MAASDVAAYGENR